MKSINNYIIEHLFSGKKVTKQQQQSTINSKADLDKFIETKFNAYGEFEEYKSKGIFYIGLENGWVKHFTPQEEDAINDFINVFCYDWEAQPHSTVTHYYINIDTVIRKLKNDYNKVAEEISKVFIDILNFK